MGRIADLLKNAAGEAALASALGRWRLALSQVADAVVESPKTSGTLNFFSHDGTQLTGPFAVVDTWHTLAPLVFAPSQLSVDLQQVGDFSLQYIGTSAKRLVVRAAIEAQLNDDVPVRENLAISLFRDGVIEPLSQSQASSALVQGNTNSACVVTETTMLVQPNEIIDIRLAETVLGGVDVYVLGGYLTIQE